MVLEHCFLCVLTDCSRGGWWPTGSLLQAGAQRLIHQDGHLKTGNPRNRKPSLNASCITILRSTHYTRCSYEAASSLGVCGLGPSTWAFFLFLLHTHVSRTFFGGLFLLLWHHGRWMVSMQQGRQGPQTKPHALNGVSSNTKVCKCCHTSNSCVRSSKKRHLNHGVT